MNESPLQTAVYRAVADGAVACRLSELGALTFEGDDAAAFLHGQLSSDVAALPPGGGQWSTYNSPKGRVLATMRLWRDPARPSRFGALVAADLAASIARRLSMFVLRAKVHVCNESPILIGIGGPQATKAVEAAFHVTPQSDGAVTLPGATIVGLGDRLVVAAHEPDASARLPASSDESVWRWLGVQSGVPLVTAATADRFVPQMLNFDAFGGVSFDKGCYPGQEIVARMRFLGHLKERLYALRTAASVPLIGARIFSKTFGDQPCGTVVNAAPDPGGGAALLAVVQIAAAATGDLSLDTLEGPPVATVPLPYAIPAVEPRTRIRL